MLTVMFLAQICCMEAYYPVFENLCEMNKAQTETFYCAGTAWSVYYDDDNVPYYFNFDTNQTVWDEPHEIRQARRRQNGAIPAPPDHPTANPSGRRHGAAVHAN